MTHPGVGPLTALATMSCWGPWPASPTASARGAPKPKSRSLEVGPLEVGIRKLLVRLFIMLRDQIHYDEFRRRGRRRMPAFGSA